MTIKPSIRPSNQPPDELPEFEVRIIVNTTKRLRALNADEASDMAWEEAVNNGDIGFDIEEVTDGAS